MEDRSIGYLRVNVRTTNGALPLGGALVIISEIRDGTSSVLYQLYTDEGGATAPVSLFTPQKSLSAAPGALTLPFAEYNVKTVKEGYYSTENINVPVYPGITSVQTVNMVPLMAGDAKGSYRIEPANESRAPEL